MGLHEGHCFFIKDIELLTKKWECSGCKQIFNRHGNYHNHVKKNICREKTEVICTGKKINHIPNSSEKVFYGGNTQFSYKACRWIEEQSKIIGKHIHHALCGHGGERCAKDRKGNEILLNGKNILFDGYEPETNTVFEFKGCKWHGCPCSSDDKIKYNETIERENMMKDLGYNVVSVWECEKPKLSDTWIEKKFIPYPYFIVYDFESILQKEFQQITDDLSFNQIHIPVSVGIHDNYEKEPTCIINENPEELVKEFIENLEKRRKKIVEKVKKEYPLPDQDSIPKAVLEKYEEWCNQVPVLGFNSGMYDINAIKRDFVKHMTNKTKDIFVARNGNKHVFLSTPNFKFLDVMSYLAPGLSFDKWCKANNCEAKKLFLDYENLDSYEKLSHVGPVEYKNFYSSLHHKMTISFEEYEEYKMEYKKRGCVTQKDWLREYNLNDVIPFKEALEKTREMYYPDKIDILKDAVSIPGVSMMYVLNKYQKIKKKGDPGLFAPGKYCAHRCNKVCNKVFCKKCHQIMYNCKTCDKNKIYKLLKTGMVGGPSIIFMRYAEMGKTNIRSHKYKFPKNCVRIVGYDANGLYLFVAGQKMPCGKGECIEVENPTDPEFIKKICKDILDGKLFGFCQVDINVPENLKEKFEEFSPLFVVDSVPEDLVPDHMKEYQKATGRKHLKDNKKLLGVTKAEKILLYTELIQWYLKHGLEITAIHNILKYEPGRPFEWFPEEVSNARRDGDIEDMVKKLSIAFNKNEKDEVENIINELNQFPDVVPFIEEHKRH